MEDVLKYQRIQGAVDSIIADDTITAAAVEGNYLVVGTERGNIHVLALTGVHIQRFYAHPKRAVQRLCVVYDGFLTIYSLAEGDESVKVTSTAGGELRSVSHSFSETVTSIAVDPLSAAYRKDGSFLVGTASGRLLQYRPGVLFGKREFTVEQGHGTSVSCLAPMQSLVAWTDADFLYVFDLSAQAAIGRVPSPCGAADRESYPSTVKWLDPDSLLLGWAYSVLYLQLRTSQAEGVVAEGSALVLKVVARWETDVVICGLHLLDAHHVVLAGLDEEVQDDDDGAQGPRLDGPQCEVQVCKLRSGELVSAETLPLRTTSTTSSGARRGGALTAAQLLFVSSYDSLRQLSEQRHKQWTLPLTPSDPDPQTLGDLRGGDRGFAPLSFVLSPRDLVLLRCRDVNDRVRAAVQSRDLRRAAEAARLDRFSLRAYDYAELLDAYVLSLLQSDRLAEAAQTLPRLLDADALLWERFLGQFRSLGALDLLALHMPLQPPRLELYLYEEVFEEVSAHYSHLLSHLLTLWLPHHLLDAPRCIEHLSHLLSALRRPQNLGINPQTAPLASQKPRFRDLNDPEPQTLGKMSLHSLTLIAESQNPQSLDPEAQKAQKAQSLRERRRLAEHYFAALALLYLQLRKHVAALACYLHRLPRISVALGSGAQTAQSLGEGEEDFEEGLDEDEERAHEDAPERGQAGQAGQGGAGEERAVFDLIERECLFGVVGGKVRRLLRLSRPLALRLFVQHVDQLPVHQVASQLQPSQTLGGAGDLLDYLQALYTDSGAAEVYLGAEHAQWHLVHLQLLIKERLAQTSQSNADPQTAQKIPESRLLAFLQRKVLPPQIALQELESGLRGLHAPQAPANPEPGSGSSGEAGSGESGEVRIPLLEERVYVLASLGNLSAALQLLLISQNLGAVLRFLVVQGATDHASQLTQTPRLPQTVREALWTQTVHYLEEVPALLFQLLESLGESGADLLTSQRVLACLSTQTAFVPRLRGRVQQLLRDKAQEETLYRACRALQQEEALQLQREKHHVQRRALRLTHSLGMAAQTPQTAQLRHSAAGASSAVLAQRQTCLGCLRPLGAAPQPPRLDQILGMLDEGRGPFFSVANGGSSNSSSNSSGGGREEVREVALCGVHAFHRAALQAAWAPLLDANNLAGSSNSTATNSNSSSSEKQTAQTSQTQGKTGRADAESGESKDDSVGSGGGGGSKSMTTLLYFAAQREAWHGLCFEAVQRARDEAVALRRRHLKAWASGSGADASKQSTTSGAEQTLQNMERRGQIAKQHHLAAHR